MRGFIWQNSAGDHGVFCLSEFPSREIAAPALSPSRPPIQDTLVGGREGERAEMAQAPAARSVVGCHRRVVPRSNECESLTNTPPNPISCPTGPRIRYLAQPLFHAEADHAFSQPFCPTASRAPKAVFVQTLATSRRSHSAGAQNGARTPKAAPAGRYGHFGGEKRAGRLPPACVNQCQFEGGELFGNCLSEFPWREIAAGYLSERC